MKDYKKLFEKGEYREIIDDLKKPENGEEALYKVSALLADSRLKEAKETFLSYRNEIYDFSPLLCLKTNLEIRFLSEEFEEAYEDEAYYQEKPYVSQRMEEMLRDYRKKVRDEERKTFLANKIKRGEIDELLASASSDHEVLEILGGIKGKLSPESVVAVEKVATSSRHDLVRTYALLVLVGDKSQREIIFKKNDKEYRLIPSKMMPPFLSKEHLAFMESLESLTKDISRRDLASHLYSDYILYLYPDTPYGEKDLSKALLSLASVYLGEKKEEELKEPLEKKIFLELGSIKPL